MLYFYYIFRKKNSASFFSIIKRKYGIKTLIFTYNRIIYYFSGLSIIYKIIMQKTKKYKKISMQFTHTVL